MAKRQKKPISREEAREVVGGDAGSDSHVHDPCTLKGCHCACSQSACGGCTCNSQADVPSHYHRY